jgi:light-regulated signal transduction histidine kinase (bacteriophytochrome)
MKPLMSESPDYQSLQALGKASVQIVHDLKNQLNGLKLYATFLRKRMEKSERPSDELDTVNKLIAGLDRTAADLSMIVQFGQPLSLKKRPGIDLRKIMEAIATSFNESPPVTGALGSLVVIDCEPVPLLGQFDSDALSEALKWISLGAIKMLVNKGGEAELRIQLKRDAIESRSDGVIEWPGFDSISHDPFRSFAGSEGIRMSLAAKVVEAHGGKAEQQAGTLRVRLPLSS